MLMLKELEEFLNTQYSSIGIKLSKLSNWINNNKMHLDIIIENKDKTATLGECQQAGKILSIWLKNKNLLEKTYISVSSPSIERELFSIEDFQDNLNEEVKIELKEKIENRKSYKGFIKNTKCDLIEIQNDDECFTINWNSIKRAKLIPDWDKILNKGKKIKHA